MLRERDTRDAAPADVMATLAELDEKLEALERGMAAARGSTQPGPGVSGQSATDRVLAQSAVADFQAAARSRSERRLLAQAPSEAVDPAAGEPPQAADESWAAAGESWAAAAEPPHASGETMPVDGLAAAGDLGRAAQLAGGDLLAGPLDADPGDAYPEPEFGWRPELPADAVEHQAGARPESELELTGVVVRAGELAGWRERLGRAIDELSTLRLEIELASTRQALIADVRAGVPAVGLSGPTHASGSGHDQPPSPPPAAGQQPVGPVAGPRDEHAAPGAPQTAAPRSQGSPPVPAVPGAAQRPEPAGPRPSQPGLIPAPGPGTTPPVGAFGGTSVTAASPPPAPATSTPTGGSDRPAGPSTGVRLPVPMPHDRLFEGRVLVDAGPFLDIAAVTAFQRALELVPGARGVDVTALDLDRAHLELELSDPVALGREIRAVFPFHFAIFEAGHGRLSMNVDTTSLSARQRAPAPR
jgi:hypothetical protein